MKCREPFSQICNNALSGNAFFQQFSLSVSIISPPRGELAHCAAAVGDDVMWPVGLTAAARLRCGAGGSAAVGRARCGGAVWCGGCGWGMCGRQGDVIRTAATDKLTCDKPWIQDRYGERLCALARARVRSFGGLRCLARPHVVCCGAMMP